MAEKTSILLIEDNPDDADLFGEVLSEIENEPFVLTSVTRLNEGIAHLDNETVDIVFLDLSLPDSHGIEGLTKVHIQTPNVPIVILTGLDDDKTALDAMRQGAQDYLIKDDIESRLLAKSIRYAIERKRAELAVQEIERVKVLAQTAITAAHLINQPLTAIIGLVDLIKINKDYTPEILEKQLTAIRKAGTQIHEIVQKMEQIERHVTTPYLDNVDMIDLDAASEKNKDQR